MGQMTCAVLRRIARILFLSLLLLSIIVLSTGFSKNTSVKDDVKRVVIIHWQNAYADLAYKFDKNLRDTLRSDSSLNLEIYTEYLQFDVLTNPEIQEETLALLEKKYKNMKVDVLITSELFDVNYILEHRERIFPNVPLVYYKVSETSTINFKTPENATGLILLSDIHESIKAIQQIQPEVDKLLFIIGSGKSDSVYHRIIKNTMLQYSEQYTCSYTIDMTFNDIINLVKELPPKTAVFYTALSRDSLGKGQNSGNLLKTISNNSTAPIYVFSDAFFEYDVLGGYVFNIADAAKSSGERALAILHGEKVESLTLATDKMIYKFKADQLEKWKINKSNLPSGSIIIDDHKNAITTSSNTLFLALVFCIMIILALVISILYYKFRAHKG